MQHDLPRRDDETLHSSGTQAQLGASLLPDEPDGQRTIRVRPAQFARMAGVSKQTVSRWIKEGKLTLGRDGRLDPNRATREVVERTDPLRMRARAFKAAVATQEELRQRVADLEAELEYTRRALDAERYRVEDHYDHGLFRLCQRIVAEFNKRLFVAHMDGQLEAVLDDMIGQEIYGQMPETGPL